MKLHGRRILVTGASHGLGAVLARYLWDEGAQLTLADIDTKVGQELARELRATFLHVDLGVPDSITELGARVGTPLHGLINNGAVATGIGGVGFEDVDIDMWDHVMRVNVRGTWLMTRAVASALRASGSGRIVNVASDTALWGAPNLISYVASKGAVVSMTRSLARELGPDGVGVTAVAPGILTTESTEYVSKTRHQYYADGRAIPGSQEPEDIAPTVAYLLTKEALALTGQLLPVNRGFVFT